MVRRLTRGDGFLAAAAIKSVVAGLLLRRWRARRVYRGRTVLVTGASRGLGLVLARELVARGARVGICARDAGDLDEARRDLEERGGEVVAVSCDVGDPVAVARMVARVRATLGPVDVLINNAGDLLVGPLETMDVEDFERAMRVHLWGPLHCSRAVIADMRQRGGGRIVNIASIGGRVPLPHMAAYTASKHAEVGLSRALRVELARDGIAVTTVCPGPVRTGSPYHVDVKGRREEELRWFTILDSLPVASIGAERAARQILRAAASGRAEVVVGLAGKLLARAHDLSPSVGARVTSWMERLLPASDPSARAPRAGAEVGVPEGPLAWPTRRAARRHHERT